VGLKAWSDKYVITTCNALFSNKEGVEMYAGVDFGTSSGSIGVWNNGGPLFLPLQKESNRLPSALSPSRYNAR